jgi:hypothetical protein
MGDEGRFSMDKLLGNDTRAWRTFFHPSSKLMRIV